MWMDSIHLQSPDDLAEGKGTLISTNEGGGGKAEHFIQVGLI